MHAKNLFEYAVIRAVPRVERQEFINVGVILYCSSLRYLDIRISLDPKKLQNLYADADVALFEKVLAGFAAVCSGAPNAGPIAQFPVAERFRWVAASRSTIIQTSPVHPGFCTDPAQMLDRIFAEMVLN